MKPKRWTIGLAALGVISMASLMQAEEKSPVLSALSQTTISGYVDTSFVWRPGNNFNRQVTPLGALGSTAGGIGFPLNPAATAGSASAPSRLVPGGVMALGKENGFNLNVVGLSFSKDMDEAEWAAGYRVDLLFGPDAVGWNPSPGAALSDFAVKQAYIDLRVPIGNGLDIRLGTFDCQLGYESFVSYKNPNYTRSWGYTLEPTQMTGIGASYKFNDVVSAFAGIMETAAPGINARAVRGGPAGSNPTSDWEKTYHASITLTAPESLGFLKGSTLTLAVIDGLGTGGVKAGTWNSDLTWLYAGAGINTPVDGLAVGIAYDYLLSRHQGSPGAAGFASSFYGTAVGAYVTYKATEKLNLALRAEYAQATDGVWYTTNIGGVGDQNAKNRLLGLTATVDYSLWANVVTRLEFRWDHDLTGQHYTDDALNPNAFKSKGPFGWDDRNNFMLALNVIYKF